MRNPVGFIINAETSNNLVSQVRIHLVMNGVMC